MRVCVTVTEKSPPEDITGTAIVVESGAHQNRIFGRYPLCLASIGVRVAAAKRHFGEAATLLDGDDARHRGYTISV